MTNALATSQASIETITVELTVIRVGRKQMTLAVFKQLPQLHASDVFTADYSVCPYEPNGPEDRLYDQWEPPIAIQGQLWGWVSYPQNGQNYRYWIVEREGKLYRVPSGMNSDYVRGYRVAAGNIMAAEQATLPQLFIAV